MQLSPEGEVNSGGYIPRREASIVALVLTKSDGLKKAASLMTTISSYETFAKRRAIFLSVRKTVNIQGYSKLREPIKTREDCDPLIWSILNLDISSISKAFLRKKQTLNTGSNPFTPLKKCSLHS